MIRPKQAKKILPKAEFEAFEAIIENQHGRMSEARLKKKATMSRRLREKYRDLARHQTIKAKRKLTNETDVSHHEARAEIFDRLIDRIETELERPNRPPPRKRTLKRKTKAQAEAEAAQRARKSITDARRRS